MLEKGKFALCIIALCMGACEQKETITMTFDKKYQTIEYGDTIKAADLIKETNAGQIQYPKLDTTKTGKQKLKFQADGKTFTYTVTIKDTKAPIIEVKEEQISFEAGSTWDPRDLITAVRDEVDGALTYAQTPSDQDKKQGYYTFQDLPDGKTAGEYTFVIYAQNKNGNSSKQTIRVTITEPAETKPTAQTNPSTPTSKPSSNSTVNSQPSAPSEPSSPSVPSTTPSSDAQTKRAQIFEQVNVERSKAGLAPLALGSGSFQAAADLRAQEIAVSFSHTRPDGSDCFSVLSQYGVSFTTAAENIAGGYPDGYAVMAGWMNSSGHRQNILTGSFTTIAIGVYGNYYVQLFIG